MMWTRIERLEDAPQEGLKRSIKHSLCNLSKFIWLVQRDDRTPVLIAGLYWPAFNKEPLLWIIPYKALRAIDWRGITKLVAKLREPLISLAAEVDPDDPVAVRTVKHLGFVPVRNGFYRWQS